MTAPTAKPTIELDIARTDPDFEGILRLQRANLRSAVDPSLHSERGFVFVEHSLQSLRRLAARMPQAIARDGEVIVGYTLAMAPDMADAVPSLQPMFEQFAKMRFRGRAIADWRYMVGGQVCVDADYRGQGLIGRLYRCSREHVRPQFELCVTEIATRNRVSLAAHRRIGFETVGVYRDAVEEWEVVAWPLAETAPD
jgi:GNAT superfamily N-acetyltransferase